MQIIMLLGAIQGFIFSGFAFFSKKFKSQSNFFLGMLILTFSYNIVQNYLLVSGVFTSDNYFRILYIPLSSVFLVLYFLYVKTYLYPQKKLDKKYYLLFLPFLIAFAESVFEKIGFAIGFFNKSDTVYFNYFRICSEVFSIIFSFILIVLSYLLILRYQKEQLSGKPGRLRIQLNWLKITTLILLFLCAYWPVPLYFDSRLEFDKSEFYFYALWAGLTLTIYSLGHIGLYHFGIVQEQKSIQKFSASRTTVPIEENNFPKSGQIRKFEEFVKTEKNYLDPYLSLESVAQKLSINKSYLSRIINSELEKSFTEYVNELRIEEAKVYIENPEFQKYTLVSIGLEVGFNSKSTFNSTFKKITGQTPSEYKSSLKSSEYI